MYAATGESHEKSRNTGPELLFCSVFTALEVVHSQAQAPQGTKPLYTVFQTTPAAFALQCFSFPSSEPGYKSTALATAQPSCYNMQYVIRKQCLRPEERCMRPAGQHGDSQPSWGLLEQCEYEAICAT